MNVWIKDRLVSVGRNPWYWWPQWYGIATGDSEFTSAFTLRGLLRKLERGA